MDGQIFQYRVEFRGEDRTRRTESGTALAAGPLEALERVIDHYNHATQIAAATIFVNGTLAQKKVLVEYFPGEEQRSSTKTINQYPYLMNGEGLPPELREGVLCAPTPISGGKRLLQAYFSRGAREVIITDPDHDVPSTITLTYRERNRDDSRER